ncbi:MAG: penicillin-binding protein 2 [Opitutales bacterium]|nr:penicillin-binding protein 2 [Opitutales bacterium]
MRNLIIDRVKSKFFYKNGITRFNAFVLLIVTAFVAIVARLWWIQMYDYENFNYLKNTVYTKYDIHAWRGTITDFNGELLAYDIPEYEIWVDPRMLGDGEEESLAPAAAKILNISEKDLTEALCDPAGRSRCVKKGATKEETDALKALMPSRYIISGKKRSRSYFPIYANRVFSRRYPKGAFASQVIGFVNKEGVAVTGIEHAFDSFLKGKDGHIESYKDKKGAEIVHKRIREIQPQNGCSIELTLDSRIQNCAEEECARIAEKFKPISACIIASEAKTGRILALANWPTFDLNKYNLVDKDRQDILKNKAVTDVYEPGSTFKITTIASALDAGIITPNTKFDCALEKAFYKGKPLRLTGESHRMGMLDVKGIVRESSNRGSAQIGMLYAEKLGEQAFCDAVKKFGYGSKTNLVGARGEQKGTVLSPKEWDGITITRFPMGHAVSVTPLQTHNAISVIANDGDFIEPQIVSKIWASDEAGRRSKPIVVYRSQTRGKVISEKTAKTMQILMRGVCNPKGIHSTAKIADIPGYNVAGKTGTTQKIKNGQYSNRHHVASFSGFFPAEKPRFIITVVVDEPSVGIGYGGSTAGPSFKRVAQEIIRQFEIPPSASDCADEIDAL